MSDLTAGRWYSVPRVPPADAPAGTPCPPAEVLQYVGESLLVCEWQRADGSTCRTGSVWTRWALKDGTLVPAQSPMGGER